MEQEANFLGIGIDYGQKKMGPSLSHLLFKKHDTARIGNPLITVCEPIEQRAHNWISVNHLEDLARVDWTPFKQAYHKIYELLHTKHLQINWGGDHSVGISTVAAFLAHYKDGHVIWIDAHADLNLPQYSPTGSLHGMPLAFLLNLESTGVNCFPWIQHFLNFSNLTYIGIRDLDPFEEKIINTYGIRFFTSEDVKNLGPKKILEQIKLSIGASPVHISFDIDCVDPNFAPATGVKAPNGLTTESVWALGNYIGHLLEVKSVDVVEINPLLGSLDETEKTMKVANQFLNRILNARTQKQRGLYDDFGQQHQEFGTTEI